MKEDVRQVAGKREESRVYEVVSKLPGVKVYRNLYVPYGRAGQTAELDLVLLNSKGMFILESKAYAGGYLVGSQQRFEWSHHYKPPGAREKRVTRFYNPLRQVERQITALSRYLGISAKHINGLVVFSSRATLKKVPTRSDSGIVVLQTHFVSSHIRRCLANRKPHFSPTELHRIAQRLDVVTNASATVKRRHILQVYQAERSRKAEQARRRASHKKR